MDFKVKHPIGLVDSLACEKGTEKGLLFLKSKLPLVRLLL